jgi:hypothetical protein
MKQYTAPTVEVIGSITELTNGHSFQGSDFGSDDEK